MQHARESAKCAQAQIHRLRQTAGSVVPHVCCACAREAVALKTLHAFREHADTLRSGTQTNAIKGPCFHPKLRGSRQHAAPAHVRLCVRHSWQTRRSTPRRHSLPATTRPPPLSSRSSSRRARRTTTCNSATGVCGAAQARRRRSRRGGCAAGAAAVSPVCEGALPAGHCALRGRSPRGGPLRLHRGVTAGSK